MKKIYYTSGTVLGVIGLILAFENIWFRVPVLLLFYQYTGSLFVPLILTFSLGMLTGWCFAMAKHSEGDKGVVEYDDL